MAAQKQKTQHRAMTQGDDISTITGHHIEKQQHLLPDDRNVMAMTRRMENGKQKCWRQEQDVNKQAQ